MHFFSKPLIFIGNLFFRKDWENLKRTLSAQKNEIPEDNYWLEKALVLSEDHRFYQHKGFDFSSILRAIWKYIFKKRIEGASTITQQLVRVLTCNYERSLKRKFKEIVLACMLEEYLDKKKQIYFYLNNAYFGWRMNGIKQAISRLKISTPLSPTDASKIIARLKYPEPHYADELRMNKIQLRELHIQNLIKMDLNNGRS